DETLLACGDQGILNILVFRAAEQGRLRVSEAALQTVVPVVPKRDLDARFRFNADGPILTGPPTVIHWAGHKPSAFHSEIYRAPMMYYRRRAASELFGLRGVEREISLLRQDWDSGLRMVVPPSLAVHGTAVKSRLRSLVRPKPGVPVKSIARSTE
ncbi:MAG TPA: hypothetical protein VF608_14340, partial [Thermoanaerobaculia bacterium]